MKHRLVALVALLAAICGLRGPADAFQSMKAQRAITLIFNVQLVYEPFDLPSAFGMPGVGLGMGTSPMSSLRSPVTVAATQGAAKVNANVIADPNAGLLVLNKTTYSVSQTSGTTATYSCAFTFQVGVASTLSWYVQDGLASDFGSGFPAADVAWMTYPTPGTAPSPPVWTNYVNYYTNNNVWQTAARGTGPITRCVDLNVSVPAGLPTGQYSATAVYSLYD